MDAILTWNKGADETCRQHQPDGYNCKLHPVSNTDAHYLRRTSDSRRQCISFGRFVAVIAILYT